MTAGAHGSPSIGMGGAIVSVLVSMTLTAPAPLPSSYRLTKTARPFGEKARNCGEPSGTGISALTCARWVSTTVTTPASRLAT